MPKPQTQLVPRILTFLPCLAFSISLPFVLLFKDVLLSSEPSNSASHLCPRAFNLQEILTLFSESSSLVSCRLYTHRCNIFSHLSEDIKEGFA